MSMSLQAVRDQSDFSQTNRSIQKLENIEQAQDITIEKIDKREDLNKQVTSQIENKNNEYKNEMTADLKEIFLLSLRQPFPTFTTETRLTAIS
jgi:hypothetical protein